MKKTSKKIRRAKTTTSMSTKTTTTMEIPEYLQNSQPEGTEHLTTDDVAMPRLQLAQSMSPQLNKQNPEYIADLSVGDLFNSVSNKNYGEGPLSFSVVCSYPPRGILFAPMAEGGGVLDMNVKMDDPRMMFSEDGTPPEATRFYDYVLMLNPGASDEEMIALSLARSAIKTAKNLNGLIRMRGTAIYTGIYTVETLQKTNTKGSYMTWKFRNAGFVPEDRVEPYAAIHAGLKTTIPLAPPVDEFTPDD